MKTMYASVLRLTARDFKLLKITDTYSMHRVVYGLFDDVRSETEKKQSISSGIQWVDKGGDQWNKSILMLSNRIPKDSVDGRYGCVEYKLLPEDFLTHTHYRFQVVLNPTRRDSKTKKLLPIKGIENIGLWIADRGENQWGFKVHANQLQIDGVAVQRFKSKSEITQQQVKVSGNLKVIDTEQFEQSFKNGIGRGRSFGCGLLQIVPTA